MELYAPPPGFVPTYTWATKPATLPTGQPVFISNVGTKGSYWYYDGTRWKLVNGSVILAALDTTMSGIVNSETLALQYLMPATLWQLKDRIRVTFTFTKSGTTDSGTVRIRIGTAGTTGDGQMNNNSETILNAASRQAGLVQEYRLETATTVQMMSVANGALAVSGYSGSGASAAVGATAVGNVSNALYVSLFALSSSTNDTVSVVDAQIELRTTPN